jgi:sulfopyruvate decarboxylase subunit alpha
MAQMSPTAPRPSPAKAAAIIKSLRRAGVGLIASLPDASLVELETALATHNELIHVPLTREEEGIGICTGAYLGGRRCAVLMQNAGMLNACNGIATTALQFEIPMLLLVLYAGYRGDMAFPQLGQVTEPTLSALRIPYYILDNVANADEVICGAMVQAYNAKKPVAILLTKGVLL